MTQTELQHPHHHISNPLTPRRLDSAHQIYLHTHTHTRHTQALRTNRTMSHACINKCPVQIINLCMLYVFVMCLCVIVKWSLSNKSNAAQSGVGRIDVRVSGTTGNRLWNNVLEASAGKKGGGVGVVDFLFSSQKGPSSKSEWENRLE